MNSPNPVTLQGKEHRGPLEPLQSLPQAKEGDLVNEGAILTP